MERQDSVSSMGSAASGMSAASSMAAADNMGGGPGDLGLDQTQTIAAAVFGVLGTLFKERWEDSRRYLALRFTMEHLQLLLILLQPHFGWLFHYEHWGWQVPNYVLLKNFIVPQGDGVFSTVMYVFAALIGASLCGCGWVCFNFTKNGFMPNKWPVRLLRLFMVVFYQVFYITILNFFLGTTNCNWLSSDKNLRFRNVDFFPEECRTLPHIAHLTVASVFSVVFILVGGLFALADVTPNPVSQNWLATAHAGVEVKTWVFRTVIVLCANVLTGFPKLQVTPILIFATWIAYVHVRWQPYYFQWMNHIRTGLYAMTAFVALMLNINWWMESALQAADWLSAEQKVAQSAARARLLSDLAMELLPAALAVGVLVSWLRLNIAVKRALAKFRALGPVEAETSPGLKDIHKFVDPYEVEIIARCCRRWTDYEDKELDQEAVKLAEMAIKAGLARFPHSAHMVLVYVNFLGSVVNSQQACSSQLQATKKLEPNWLDRYVIFVRDQQQAARLQQHTGSNMESALDLVGYVEFQHSYRQVLRAHKSALFAQRSFWKVLLHSNVSFTAVVKAFKHIESTRTRADKTYQTVLERYPTNVKVLRAYARFLEDVKNDPWSASKYYTEADKLEEQEGADGAEALSLLESTQGGDAAAGGIKQVDEKTNAVCVINATGTIQMANKVLLKMFGYRKGELEGKNVSMLMPQPYSGRHNGYLRNYQTTGVPKILDKTQEMVALHKEHYVFPMTLAVTRVSGTGAEAMFMGVMKPAREDAGAVKAWIMPGGIMLCVDARFTDWFGKSPVDCVGRPISTLAVDGDALTGLVERAMTAKPQELEAGLVCLKGVALTHKYADPVIVDITIELGGTDAQRLLVATIRKCSAGDSDHLMVTDHKGRIIYVTSKLAELLGSTPKALLRTDFARLMAQPFMQLHSKWMKDMPGKVPAGSCRAGAPVVLISQQRVPIPAKVDISSREQGEDNIYIVKVTPCTFPVALNSRRLSLSIDSCGNILEVGDSPASVFGFAPGLLLGRNIAECVDIFRGLPERDGPQGLDIEHLLTALVHKVLEQKEASWRCGVHPPMTAAEVAAAQSHVIQANMLASRTKAALLSLEVIEHADDGPEADGAVSITVHLWRSEMMLGVVEVDREGLVAKAGCCALHQPGPLLGVSSNALLRTPLSRWLNVPGSYDGLLLDAKKKGALKRKAADVKVGPLRHARGVHNDGDQVYINVQAVVKEGGGPDRLVVKLGIEKASKGHPDFARRMLGLAVAAGGGAEEHQQAAAAAVGNMPGQMEEEEVLGSKSVKARGGVTFGVADAAAEDEPEDAAGSDGRASGDDEEGAAKPKKGKSDRIAEWVRQASGLTAATAITAAEAEDSMAANGFAGGLPPPPDEQPDTLADGYMAPPETNLAGGDAGSVMSGGDGASSAPDGSEVGAYESDFKRGKRLRRLARMLSGKQAQKASSRFYKQACLIILGLLVAHTACFIASVTLINAQDQYIQEVDDAGAAVITLHRMAIDCRVLDALYKGIEQPGIFTRDQMPHFAALFEEAIDLFHTDHERTYLGRSGTRRFKNRIKYKLQDYWESHMWNVTSYVDTVPPIAESELMGMWELGNWVVASAREVLSNHERMTANGTALSSNRFWRFVMDNGPWALYSGYKLTLYGLVERATAKMGEVSDAMVLMLVLEGCVLFVCAAIYIAFLIKRMVLARANLFSVFLVIPTGFLRALASKQVVLDEDADSDEGSDAGADVPQQRQEGEQQDAQKVNLSIFGKKSKQPGEAGGPQDFFSKQQQQRGSLIGRLANSLNPLSWFGSSKAHKVDTGKKQLVRNSRDTFIVVAPFAFWAGLIIFAYVLTIFELKSVQGPFRMLNMINFLVFRVTRGVLFALEICMASPDAAMIELRKQQTMTRLHDMQRDYTSFLYGFEALPSNEEPDDLSTNQAAVFENSDLAHIFFRTTDCLRKDASTCYPLGHPFYDVSHNGLDAMATRFMQETALLLADDPRDINISNSRLQYIWQLGRNDLFDGMQLADNTFRKGVEHTFVQVRTVHVVVFVLSLFGALLLWLGLVRPTLKAAGKESRQIAEMLSQLPPEMDVEAIIAQVVLGEDEDDAPAANKKGPRQGSSTGMNGMPASAAGGGFGYNNKRSVDGIAGGGGGGNRRSLDLPVLANTMPGWS